MPRVASILLASGLAAAWGCDEPAPAPAPASPAAAAAAAESPSAGAAHQPSAEPPAGPLTAGTRAPELAIPDQQGNVRRLADFRGKKLVLYFYPRDATPGCTVEARGFRDAHRRFEEAGAVVIGISTDSVESHAEFAADERLTFPLLADTDHRVARAYGVDVTMGFASRVTFVIDSSGMIERVFPDVDPREHADEVLAAL